MLSKQLSMKWGPRAYCIKLLPEKHSGYFNQSFFPVVKSMVKIMLTQVFRFYRSFSPIGKVLCNGPLVYKYHSLAIFLISYFVPLEYEYCIAANCPYFDHKTGKKSILPCVPIFLQKSVYVVMYRKFRYVPIFKNCPPICPYFLGFRVGRYCTVNVRLGRGKCGEFCHLYKYFHYHNALSWWQTVYFINDCIS